MASFVFDKAKINIFDDNINLGTDMYEMRLVTAVPDEINAEIVGDLAAVEYSDPSYAPVDITTRTVQNGNETEFGVDTSATGGVTIFPALDGDPAVDRIEGVVIVRKDGVDPAKRYVVTFNQFTTPYAPNGADLTISLPNNVIVKAR